MAQLNWNSKEVIDVISNPNLSIRQMSEILGRDIFSISRHRSKLGLPRLHSTTGLDRPMTNAERKRRYNVRLKANGWKPLCQTKRPKDLCCVTPTKHDFSLEDLEEIKGMTETEF